MLLNYLKIAFRNISKRLIFSLINIFGLIVGLTCSILILLWANHELSFDNFNEHADRIYRVVTELSQGENSRKLATTPGPLAAALNDKYPEIESFSRIYETGSRLVTYGEKKFLESGFYFADPEFFDIFSFPIIHGSALPTSPDIDKVVISKSTAKKYFGVENPIGKILQTEKLGDLVVCGVTEDVPDNSHLQFDIIASFDLLKKIGEPLEGWGRFRYYSYILIEKNADQIIVREKVENFFKDSGIRIPAELHLQKLTKIYFNTDYSVDISRHGNKNTVYILISIAILILLIACINYMNLSTAYAGKRAKEVGLRKVAGALRLDIIKQYFSESLLMTFIAFILALVCVELLLTPYNNLLGTNLELNFTENSRIFIGLFALALFTGLVSGSYPAFFLSSFSPAKVVKGIFGSGENKAPLRKILVVTQFTLSIGLIIAALTVFRQLDFIKNKALGFEKEQILVVPFHGEMHNKYHALKAELTSNPEIVSVSAANALPHRIGSLTSGISWEGKDPEKRQLFRFASVDLDFVNTLDIPVIQGRNFSKEFTTDINHAFLINQKAAEQLGFDSPIGKNITFHGQRAQIIGVIKNFHSRSLYDPIEPLFLGILPDQYNYFNMFVKIKSSNFQNAVDYIHDVYAKYNSNYPFDYIFLDESINNFYKPIEKLREMFVYFAGLAILLSCLGLFGLASFMTEQRIKEVGIRKVLGASVSGILVLLSKEFSKWVIISNIIAWPLAWYAMHNWLENFAYKTDIAWWLFVVAGLLAFVVAGLTISSQAIKAALANPIEALRYE